MDRFMNKKFLVALGIAFVVVCGFILFLGSQNDQANTEIQTESSSIETEQVSISATVTYNNDGFDPKEQTISSGQTVRFTNNSSYSLWIASGSQPGKEDYPEFDSKRGIGPGEEFDFRFDKVGKWVYRNALNSSDIGTIIVTE
jgi:plastocyanin